MSDTTELVSTSGAFAPKAWERASRRDLINGVWILKENGPDKLLTFARSDMTDLRSCLVLPDEDIDGVEEQAGGFNLIVNVYAEVKDERAVFTMVAPRGRMK